MLTLPLPAQLDGERLRDELAAAGVVVKRSEMAAVGVMLTFDVDESFRAVVEGVVAAHTGAQSTREANWTAAHHTLRVAAPFLRDIKNTTGTLSAARLSDGFRLLAELMLPLISVALHQDDPADDPVQTIS